MSFRGNPPTAAVPDLSPSVGAADLYKLAQKDPRMWQAIAAHPNAYPDLLDWLERVGPQPVKTAVALRRTPPTPSPRTEAPGVATVAEQLPADRTMLAKRSKRAKPLAFLDWGDGTPTLITKEEVVIGRRIPRGLKTDNTQIVEIEDPTKTVSAKHARLKRINGQWFIEDLDSTNGIHLVDESGGETEVEKLTAATPKFYLGDVCFHLEPKA